MELTKEGTLKRAQEMAEAFAKDRARDFTANFLNESGLFEDQWVIYKSKERTNPLDHEQFFDVLIDDYEPMIGQMLAISYALGYVDKAEGKCIKQLITSLRSVKK